MTGRPFTEDQTSKAAAWDAAMSSNAKGYRRGVKAALDVIAELRRVYRPADQGRQRFTIHDMERAFKGGLDIAREDIEKLLDEPKSGSSS